MSEDNTRYDHIDPTKLTTAADRALYEALVRHVDNKNKKEKESETSKTKDT